MVALVRGVSDGRGGGVQSHFLTPFCILWCEPFFALLFYFFFSFCTFCIFLAGSICSIYNGCNRYNGSNGGIAWGCNQWSWLEVFLVAVVGAVNVNIIRDDKIKWLDLV